MKLPHPTPYQGSKRLLAPAILGFARGREVRTLYEPFAGSAAFTIAAASERLATRYVIGDSLEPLVSIWTDIIGEHATLSAAYERVWSGQKAGDDGYFARVRDRYNGLHGAADLLYLLARCVKNSPRWNREGHFNQGVDRRRLGMNPARMNREIAMARELLHGRAIAVCGDFEATVAPAGPSDLVYMDPPYEGTSVGRDRRYHAGLDRSRLIDALGGLNRRDVPWILSYDGRCGEKTYGTPLPSSLHATRVELHAGRSTQATLNGGSATTVESLYLSSHFAAPVRP